MSSTDNEPSVKAIASAKYVPTELIAPNPHQPRHSVTAEDVAELTSSIQANGIIEPLIVCPNGHSRADGNPDDCHSRADGNPPDGHSDNPNGHSREGGNPADGHSREGGNPDGYILIAGYRRLTAAKAAGLSEVPCIIRTGSTEECLLLSIIENIQRTDLTYIEEAESYKKLMDEMGMDQQTVAERMHKSPVTICERLALLSLPQDIQEQVTTKQLSVKAALELGKIADPKRRAKLAVKANRLDLEEIREIVHKILEKQKQGRKKHEKRTAHPRLKVLLADLPVKRVKKTM